ncbi:MAG: hypothetical protein K2K39_00730 [Clostridia bacterium]|nr:hypothetical protein [Clostridia bacterium]
MKKDDILQSAFDDYFEGGAAPRASVTDAAKNSITGKKATNSVVKKAIIGISAALSACAAVAGSIFAPVAIGGIIDRGDDGGKNEISYYAASDLSATPMEIYSQNNPAGLEFMKNLELASNFSVNSYNGYSNGEAIAYVKAEVTATVNSCRHDAVIYAEYTQTGTACELFESYYAGTTRYFEGNSYLYSLAFEEGEYVSNALFKSDGVRYYLTVKSSDEYAYLAYMDLILK